MVVYKLSSNITRNPEEASPQLALSGVTGTQVCSVFLLIHSELVAERLPSLLVSPLHSGQRQEGKREDLSWLYSSPSVKKAKVPPGGPVASPRSRDCCGCLGEQGCLRSMLAYCLRMCTPTSKVNQGSLREEGGKNEHGVVISSVCCM